MCDKGPEGEEGPPGPITLVTLIREWIKEDPILSKHFFFTEYEEGTYLETRCDWSHKINQHSVDPKHTGYSLALFPHERYTDKRVMVFYHGREYDEAFSRVRGYLKRENPHFIESLRKWLILGHDSLCDITKCKIKWEFGETLSDREAATRQPWWKDGEDL